MTELEFIFTIAFISGIALGFLATFLFIDYSEKKYYDRK